MPAGDASRSVPVLGHHDETEANGSLLSVLATLSATVGELTRQAEASDGPKIPWEAAHPAWFTGSIPLSAGAGTLGVTQDTYGPTTNYWWDVRWIGAQGFTAGTVTMYRNIIGGEVLAIWSTAGEFTWSAQKMLSPEDDLVWQAAGITGSVFITGQAIEVKTSWLPEYLM